MSPAIPITHRLGAAVALAGIVAWAWWSWTHDGLLAVTFAADADPAARLQSLRDAFARFGVLAPLVYIVAVTVEVVVAPLPGLLLYAPGGVIFGGFWGGLLSLIGNVVGAGLAFLLARAWGRPAASRYFAEHELAAVERRLSSRGLWIVMLLRINPLTSSDLISYAAGLTSMRLSHLLLGTALGMAPLCWLQAYFAAGLLEEFPWLLMPLLAVALTYAGAAVWWVAAQRRSSAG